MEHRWGERVAVEFPVRVTTHQFNVRHGKLTNLSVSGAFIEADFDARVLTRIHVLLMSQHWPKHTFHDIPAYVTRRSRQGIGIEWCDFAPRQVADLLRGLARRPYAHVRNSSAGPTLAAARLPGSLLRHGS